MVYREWIFREFVDADGKAPFTIWLSGRSWDAQAAIDKRILVMMALPSQQWSSKWIRPYAGYDKLFELRIPHNKVQYRPLGCYGPDRQEFTIVAGAIEKNWKIPKSILDVAMKRIALVGGDRRWNREYQFDTE